MITGCAKLEVGMNIKKDKSMTLGIIQAVDKSLLEPLKILYPDKKIFE